MTSADGTQIAWVTTGSGPLLVIVGGALADHSFYTPLAEELAGEFTVRTYDRRGRGGSGDTAPYAVEREVEDLAAVIGDEPALVYGHSAGAALALRAASDGVPMRALVLADLPHDLPGEAARARFAEESAQVRVLHEAGDHAGVAAFFLGSMGLPAADVRAYLDSPAGPGLLDCARALPYDYAVLGDGTLPLDQATTVSVPTLVLAAEDNPETARALVAVVPGATLHLMPASTHELPPDAIASAILPFLRR